MASKKRLDEQAKEILIIAEKSGVRQNFFFVTTFKRYQVQLKMLDELEKVLKDTGTMVTKEYVKNRQNLYENPAIGAYNKTADSANKTVSTLMRIVKEFADDDAGEEDPLLKIINGDN